MLKIQGRVGVGMGEPETEGVHTCKLGRYRVYKDDEAGRTNLRDVLSSTQYCSEEEGKKSRQWFDIDILSSPLWITPADVLRLVTYQPVKPIII